VLLDNLENQLQKRVQCKCCERYHEKT